MLQIVNPVSGQIAAFATCEETLIARIVSFSLASSEIKANPRNIYQPHPRGVVRDTNKIRQHSILHFLFAHFSSIAHSECVSVNLTLCKLIVPIGTRAGTSSFKNFSIVGTFFEIFH